ncbi:MAG TPA: hypothetical protein VHR84_11485 [Terriglobales bacterium]|jgi:hypothetical protein|nr:hypothetical protein [Terriglobales bacterium]
MTYLDAVYRYESSPTERVMRALDAMREVYGIRRIEFAEKDKSVRVEFDASRMNEEVIMKLLKQAGLDVRERLSLA